MSQDCSLSDPCQKLFAKFWSVEKHGRCEGVGAFFTVWPLSKIVCEILIRRKTWPLWGGGRFFHCVDFREILQNYSTLELLVRFWNNFTGLFLGWPISKSVRQVLIRLKTWPPWGWVDFLHYTDMEKFLKTLLLWNPWSDLEIISQECSFGDAFQKFFLKFWSVDKHSRRGGGRRLFALYGHEEILKKSSLKPLVRFEIISQESGFDISGHSIALFRLWLLQASCLHHLWHHHGK